jgi:hypothetical protein
MTNLEYREEGQTRQSQNHGGRCEKQQTMPVGRQSDGRDETVKSAAGAGEQDNKHQDSPLKGHPKSETALSLRIGHASFIGFRIDGAGEDFRYFLFVLQ